MAKFGVSSTKRNNAIRKDLPARYPGISFEVKAEAPSGRNHYKELSVAWTGGPQVEELKHVLASEHGVSWSRVAFGRRMTEEERAVWQAEQDAQRAAWDAAAPEREAARVAKMAENRSAGRSQAAETRKSKLILQTRLAERFPGVVFTLTKAWGSTFDVEWTGGPLPSDVAEVEGVSTSYRGTVRHATPEEIEAAKRKRSQAELKDKLRRARVMRELQRFGCDLEEFETHSLKELQDTLAPLRKLAQFKRRVNRYSLPRRRLARLAPRRVRPSQAQLMLPVALPTMQLTLSKRRRPHEFDKDSKLSLRTWQNQSGIRLTA